MIRKKSKVTPSNQKSITYDEESWKPTLEDSSIKEKSSDISAHTSSSHSKPISKTKKVKKYFKRCKNALASSKSSSSFDCDTASQSSDHSSVYKTSWYFDKNLEHLINEGEVKEIEDVFEDALVEPLVHQENVNFGVANVIHVKGPRVFRNSSDTSEREKRDIVDKNALPEKSECINISSDISSNTENIDNFESALNSLNLQSDDCDFFSLEYDDTLSKHKQNVLESFSNLNTAKDKELKIKDRDLQILEKKSNLEKVKLNEFNIKDSDKSLMGKGAMCKDEKGKIFHESKISFKHITSSSLNDHQGNIDGKLCNETSEDSKQEAGRIIRTDNENIKTVIQSL